MSKPQRQLLPKLKRLEDVHLTNTDKNLGAAIMEKKLYDDLCDDHLDSGPYQLTNLKPEAAITLMKDKVAKFYNLMSLGFVENNDDPEAKMYWNQIIKIIIHQLDDSKIPTFQGLPKIHKPKLKIRPIIASVVLWF